MYPTRPLTLAAVILIGVAVALMAACGGGGTTVANDSGGVIPGPVGGDMPSPCGITQPTGLTLPGPAEGAWSGSVAVLADLEHAYIYGAVGADGEAGFSVGFGELWAGSVLASPNGAVQTMLTRYARLSGTPGGPKNPGIRLFTGRLVFDSAEAQTTLAGRYTGGFASCGKFTLSFSDSYLRPASLTELAGSYSASTAEGYSLTVTIHQNGQFEGSDSLGCVLSGNVSVPDPAKNHYRAFADASNCGILDGHYDGMMVLRDEFAPNDNLSLFLALSNPDTAIFYSLTR